MKNKVTIGILTYNHEKYIEKCLRSALELDYENLEIIISDDCSKDSTFDIVQKIISTEVTEHTVILNRNDTNIGLAGNFNKIFGELATGDFLVTLGGDDAIKENYFEEVLAVFEKDHQIMMVDVNADIIDENGVIARKATDLKYDQKLSGLENYLALESVPSFAPGRMIRKELLTYFSPISHQCPTEDSVLVVRSLLLGKHCRLNISPILYRRHSSNVSSAENLRKLTNHRIIAQYIADALITFDKNDISEFQIEKTLERFRYELKRRDIVYADLPKYYKKVKCKLLHLNYKIK